jgi:hypothetical protein
MADLILCAPRVVQVPRFGAANMALKPAEKSESKKKDAAMCRQRVGGGSRIETPFEGFPSSVHFISLFHPGLSHPN